jgi:ribonuclease PH
VGWQRDCDCNNSCQLRDLALALHNSGLSLTDCVTGLRVALSSRNLGIDMDEAEHFLAEIYTTCVSKGLEPRYVAKLLEDVVSLSDGLNLNQSQFNKNFRART